MSAYLCSDCHITALAEYALRHRIAGRLVAERDRNYDPLLDLGGVLKAENAKSLLARYGAEAIATWPEMYDRFEPCKHVPPAYMQIVKAAHCYAYQACEHDGWHAEGNLVRELVERVADHALRQTPEYQRAGWGYDCEHP